MTQLRFCFGRRLKDVWQMLCLAPVGPLSAGLLSVCLVWGTGCRPAVEQVAEAERKPDRVASPTAEGAPAQAESNATAGADRSNVAAIDSAPNPAANAALLKACQDNDRDGVRKALEAGADVNTVDEDGRTPLMWACFDGREAIVLLLLEHKARVNERDGAGRTALMYASTGSFRDTVRLLLQHGAEVDLRDKAEGFTALMFASAEGQLEVVKELLAHHADRTLVDVDGDTAADFAQRNGHAQVVQALQQ